MFSTILISGYLSIKLLLVSQWVQTIVSLLIKPDSAIIKTPVSTAIILDEFLWAILNVENNFQSSKYWKISRRDLWVYWVLTVFKKMRLFSVDACA